MSRDHQFSVGDVVFDSHQESPDSAVVVNIPPRQANEWTVYTDTTVADDNPDYPDDSPIVVVAFYDDLSEQAEELLWPELPIPLKELHEYDVKDYAFPLDRIKLIDDSSLPARHSEEKQETPTEANDESETTSDADGQDEDEPEGESDVKDDEVSSAEDTEDEQDLHELQEFLDDNGVQAEIRDGAVIVEKLGETYQLSTDGEVQGDGPYQERLEQLLTEAPV